MADFVHPVNVLEVLEEFEFPGTVPELVAYAEDQDASEDVLDLIQAMPEREYESIQDVARHLNQIAVMEGEENIYSSAAENEARHEPHAADDANIARTGHQLKNWARSGRGDEAGGIG